MHQISRMTTALASLALLGGVALAAELKPFQTEAKEKFDTEIEAPLKAANAACGVTFTVKTNFEAYKEADWSGNSVSSRCQAVIDSVAALCERKAYKAAVAKKIKEIHCMFGGKDGETPQNMSVTGSAMVYKMHPNNSNLADHAKKTLEDAINK